MSEKWLVEEQDPATGQHHVYEYDSYDDAVDGANSLEWGGSKVTSIRRKELKLLSE